MSAGSRQLPGFLAMCFGLCLPEHYSAVPTKEPAPQPPKPSRPCSNWREIPLVAKYDLLKQIGKGGFSEIWLSENRESKEMVAIKVVQLANADLEPDEVTTLLSEAKYLRTLDCPYMLRCYETAATGDWLVLVLEYLSGGEMLDHIHKVKKYTEAEAGKLFAQVVSAVSYLHTLNLIHRDIKPENVMFTAPVEVSEAEGRPLRVKLIDLGMAALYDPKKEMKGCIGTPGFVAPELFNDGPQTPACDIYSLGVMLFIMLTGRKPHSGVDIRMMTYCNKSIKDAPGLQDERFLSLSPAARALLLAMLADDPRDRPSAQQVLKHAFITAVDASAEAHREMGDVVRRRMRDLGQLRRVHGLRYALQVQRRGADHQTFLEEFDRKRLKLKGGAGSFARASDARGFGRASQPGEAAAPAFARSSLYMSYDAPPAAVRAPDQNGTVQRAALAVEHSPEAFGVRTAGGASTGSSRGACETPAPAEAGNPMAPPQVLSPFARVSTGSSAAGGSRLGASRLVVPALARTSRPQQQAAPEGTAEADGMQTAGAAAAAPDLVSTAASLPDANSRDLGQPVPNGLAARPPALPPLVPPTGRTNQNGAARGGAGGGGGGGLGLPHIDPMVLVNALPALQHAPTMPLDDATDGERADGGSPVATSSLIEQAFLAKSMSANPYTLELLEHQETLNRVLNRER